MKTVELKARVRENVSKQTNKKVRSEGDVPAVVYGADMEPIAIQVNAKEFSTLIHGAAGENAVITLKIDGGTEKTVLVNEMQHDPVSDTVQHIDFHAISLTEKITAEIPVQEKGESIGLKEGGVLDHVHRTVEVECLPTALPDKLIVVIDELKINEAIHVKDIQFPEGVTCLLDPEEVVIKILPPKKEETPAEEEGEAKEPEVITAKKEEAEGSEKDADKK